MRSSRLNKYKYHAKNLFENWTNNKETCSISTSQGWRLQGGILAQQPIHSVQNFANQCLKAIQKSSIDNQTEHNNETASSFVHNFCTMAGETCDSIEWSSFSVGPWQRQFIPQWAG